MNAALWLLAFQGVLGGFDTLYYHEWRARLPAGGARTRPELWLHGWRSTIYAVLFTTLPWLAWRGACAWVLAGLIAVEIVLTGADFAIEVRTREPVGVLAGERVTHGLMAIVYGAALACLAPAWLGWRGGPSGFAWQPVPIPAWLRLLLGLQALGVLASALRDLLAAQGVLGAAFPWHRAA